MFEEASLLLHKSGMTTSFEWHATTQTIPPLSLSLDPENPAKPRLYGESNSRSLEYLRRPARSATAPASPNETPVASGASTPQRPSLVRKKSGQLVKSSLKLPSLVRTKSLPNTKNVHFAAQESLVDIRRFNRSERPASVSLSESDPSDSEEEDEDEDEWEMRAPNFQPPRFEGDAQRPDVYLEQVALCRDKVRGSVLVRNLGFQKRVVLRYTVDFWASVNEIEAQYTSDIRLRDQRAGLDRFQFELPIRALPLCRNSYNATTVFFAIRYTVNHKEFWDNNRGMNYELSFKSTRDHDEEGPRGTAPPAPAQRQQRPQLGRVPSFLSEEPAGIPLLQKETNPFKSRYSFGSALSSPQYGEHRRASVDAGIPGNYQDILDRFCFYIPKHASGQLPTPANTPPVDAQDLPSVSKLF